ncbi:MAG: Flp pilus assembly protein CpaB [Dongiaceae bacterium]
MSLKKVIFLVLIVVIVGVVIVSMSGSKAPAPAPVAAKKDLPSILVAKVDVPAGTFIKADHLTWQEWPSDNILDAYAQRGKQTPEEFAGAVARNGLRAGEPVLAANVVKPGDRGFMAAVLTPGMRAISIQVNDTSGISGFVFPGDYVDILLTQFIQPESPASGGTPPARRASETFMQNIRILAVDQRVDNQKPEAQIAKTATVEVTPKQAETLAVASEMGKLSLALRPLAKEENETVRDRNFTWDREVSTILAPIQAPRSVRVVRGNAVQEESTGGGG